MHVNQWDDGIEPLKQVLEAGATVDPDSLAAG